MISSRSIVDGIVGGEAWCVERGQRGPSEGIVVVLVGHVVLMFQSKGTSVVLAVGSTMLMATPSPVLPTVPPVLDGVVASSLEPASNLGPALAHLRDHLLDLLAFLGRDGVVIQRRLEVLVVTLPALFGRACSDGMRDPDPVGSPVLLNQSNKIHVLGLRPRPTAMVDHGGKSRRGSQSLWIPVSLVRSRPVSRETTGSRCTRDSQVGRAYIKITEKGHDRVKSEIEGVAYLVDLPTNCRTEWRCFWTDNAI